METKSTKQTFKGYTNWQTWNLVNWALDEGPCDFEVFKLWFENEYYKAHAIVQSQIDLTEINWDEIKKAMEGEE